MFEPGGCQFGDGLSRNPDGRDRAREEAEHEEGPRGREDDQGQPHGDQALIDALNCLTLEAADFCG